MKEMRRKDRELSKDLALAVVDKSTYSILATVSPNGNPYCIPLSMVREGEWLYFHCALEGHKLENLKFRNKVCVTCVGDVEPIPGDFAIEFESAVINGTASEISVPEEKIHALRLISERYAPDNMPAFDEYVHRMLERTGVWKIHIDEISGKAKKLK